jgi:hypothetical protein
MDAFTYFDKIVTGMGFRRQESVLPRVRIKPGSRANGDQVFAGPGDIEGEIAIGYPVRVFEPESGLVGTGVAVSFDPGRQLLCVAVDWSSLTAG